MVLGGSGGSGVLGGGVGARSCCRVMLSHPADELSLSNEQVCNNFYFYGGTQFKQRDVRQGCDG